MKYEKNLASNISEKDELVIKTLENSMRLILL